MVDLVIQNRMFTSEICFANIPESVLFTVGQNAADNIDVIRNAFPNDLWFHANEVSSCHVVARIRTGLTKKQIHTIVKYGCALCKNHTLKLKKQVHVEFVYTEVKNIDIPDNEPVGTVHTKKQKYITI